jgi:hypothetical protein
LWRRDPRASASVRRDRLFKASSTAIGSAIASGFSRLSPSDPRQADEVLGGIEP